MKRASLTLSVALGLGLAGLDSAADEVFQFKTPHPRSFRTGPAAAALASDSPRVEWLRTWRGGDTNAPVELGDRVVLQLRNTNTLQKLIAGRELQLARVVTPDIVILQSPDARTAAREAHRLAMRPEVLASYPVMRQPVDWHGPYAARPTDTFFENQWPIEHRNADGSSAGADLNVRAAWPFSTGQGVTLAIADVGVELAHPEFAGRVAGAPHFNFDSQTTNGNPVGTSGTWAHGTAVAGLAAASLNKNRMVGVAPGTQLASWVIHKTNTTLVSDERLMDMFQYASNTVAVQNHSWGHVGLRQNGLTVLEAVGISNAVAHGRDGLGVVIVRSGGNDREQGANANDDGYSADPRVISVGAVRLDGRATTYSEPGACILVAAPSGDAAAGMDGLFTTDLLGTHGVNQLNFFPPFEDMNGYGWGSLGFSGTSAAAPQIAGVVALMLSANPTLGYRDVQQILIFASRHFDFADPDLRPNGAGLPVSHNAGFGVPDAGEAVRLASRWPNRPPFSTVTLTATNHAQIPDAGFRVLVTGSNVPPALDSILALPSLGPNAGSPTPSLPLVYVGPATNPIPLNLTNTGALIERSGNDYAGPILRAARAGAAFAIIHNFATNTSGIGTPGGEQFAPMVGTDFVPLPSGFITYNTGMALRGLLETNGDVQAQISLNSTSYVFTVTNTLLCEHVGVRVMTDHPIRSDVRITLDSPAGTRSVLQRLNSDTAAGPVDWTYYSTHHFFEGTPGVWTVSFSDEFIGSTGTVTHVSLILHGVPIRDRDGDGLDDYWEIIYADCLAALSPDEDPDADGATNAREQLLLTDPTFAETALELDLSRWNAALARLSWPGNGNYTYDIRGGANVAALSLITNVPGHFPETEWFGSYTNSPHGFFQVRAIPLP